MKSYITKECYCPIIEYWCPTILFPYKFVSSTLLYINCNDNNKPLFPSSTNVLLPITHRVVGKHHWCWVLNILLYVARAGATYYQKRVVLPKANKNYMIKSFTFPKPTQHFPPKRNSTVERMLFEFYQTLTISMLVTKTEKAPSTFLIHPDNLCKATASRHRNTQTAIPMS